MSQHGEVSLRNQPNIVTRWQHSVISIPSAVDDDDDDEDREPSSHAPIYEHACASFCRGRLSLLGTTSDAEAVAAGRAAGLRLHRFKRARVLPRVQRILSTLRGLQPRSVLDVGTGRGVMLWPLLEAFPHLPVTCIDARIDRVDDLRSVGAGGIDSLHAEHSRIEDLKRSSQRYDVVIASEVLEHVVDAREAAAALLSVAERFVIVTVPSQPDDNPEHVRLFSVESLRQLWLEVGASKVAVDGIAGHWFAVITVSST